MEKLKRAILNHVIYVLSQDIEDCWFCNEFFNGHSSIEFWMLAVSRGKYVCILFAICN